MMMKLTIDRKRWFRGQGGDNSALLRKEDGTMCCLGFLARECGLSEEEISGVSDFDEMGNHARDREIGDDPPDEDFIRDVLHLLPEQIARPRDMEGRGWTIRQTSLTDDMIGTNDDPDIADHVREQVLMALFAEAGVEVEFVG